MLVWLTFSVLETFPSIFAITVMVTKVILLISEHVSIDALIILL